MHYKSQLTFKERTFLLLTKLPWKFKKICPGYLRELDNTCLKITKMGGEIIPHQNKLEVHFHGNKYILRVGSTDFLVFDQVILGKEYQPIVDLIKNRNKDLNKLNIIDAGANVGFASLFFSYSFRDSLIISLEPEKNNFQALENNILINEKKGKIIPIEAGIWGKDAEMVLNHSFRDGREWSLNLTEANSKDSDNDKIKGYSLDSILSKQKIQKVDFLKIDIEGGEKNLFDDWGTNINVFKLIKFIAIEIHDEIADRKLINSMLKNNGFEIIEIGETTFGENMNLL